MQTTRSPRSETLERRPATSPRSEPGPRSRPRFRTVLFVVLGVGVLVASVIGSNWVLNTRRQHELPVDNGPVDTQPVGFGHGDVEGGVIPLHPTQPGRVVEVLVKENQPVTKGEVLLRLDDRKQQNDVRQAEAAVNAATARLKQAENLRKELADGVRAQQELIAVYKAKLDGARAQLQRATSLFEARPNPLIRQEELDVARAAVREAEAAVKARQAELDKIKVQDPELEIARARANLAGDRAQLDQARYALEETQLKAPADGTILRLTVNPGELLGSQPKQPAIIFCPNTPRIVRAEVDQESAGRIHVGQAVLIQDDARLTGEWRGKVKRISDWYSHRRSLLLEPGQFNDVRTLECIIELDPKQPHLRIGQRVRVTFEQ
jgi:multidrug resistance efflux pump